MSTSYSVRALVPLAVLEAIRNLDTPLDDGLHAELADETLTKRLGLSATVGVPIEREREKAGTGESLPADEGLQVFRLAGRRPDADLVFSDAGRRAARYALRHPGARASSFWRALSMMGWRSARHRVAASTIKRAFDLEVGDHGGAFSRANTIAVQSGFAGSGCQFYTSLLGEVLRLTKGFEGAVVHDQCRARGDSTCRWITAESDQYW